jgi:hypothetical protein
MHWQTRRRWILTNMSDSAVINSARAISVEAQATQLGVRSPVRTGGETRESSWTKDPGG